MPSLALVVGRSLEVEPLIRMAVFEVWRWNLVDQHGGIDREVVLCSWLGGRGMDGWQGVQVPLRMTPLFVKFGVGDVVVEKLELCEVFGVLEVKVRKFVNLGAV